MPEIEEVKLNDEVISIEKPEDIEYHRNGIAGIGFWAVKFNYGRVPLIATIEARNGSLIGNTCRVLSQSLNLDESWRGDNFSELIYKEMKNVDLKILFGIFEKPRYWFNATENYGFVFDDGGD